MAPDDLVQRYLDNRSALLPPEMDELIAALRAEPARAAAVREQLMVDDLLAQKLAVDRRNFPAQVAQRLADFERGQEELDQQVSELRELAEAEIERPQAWSGSSPWVKWVLALSAAVLIGGAFLAGQWLPGERHHVAKVVVVSGDVTVHDGGRSSPVTIDGGLLTGQRLIVPAGGRVQVEYQDATTVRLGESSAVTFDLDRRTGGKQVQIDRGEVWADIQPQQAAMVFKTPHAVATVLGTKLRLSVSQTQTLLDVTEGRVQLDRTGGGQQSQLVAANETGIASQGEFRLRPLAWPLHKASAAYVLSPLEVSEPGVPLMCARNPESGNLRETRLLPQGDAALVPGTLRWQLAGGYLQSDEAGPDLRSALADKDEFSLEVVFTPASESFREPATIVALADANVRAIFALIQQGRELTFAIRTTAPAEEPLRIPLVASGEPLSAGQQERHVAITYRSGELIAWLQGAEVARSNIPRGPLTDWREGALSVGAAAGGERVWRGEVAALALHSRVLTPDEISRSVASFRLLANWGK